MSKKLFLNFVKYLSVFGLVFFCGINSVFAKENSSTNIKSSVSATSNSGGNTISGAGTITTGDANATAKSVTVVNGGESAVIKTEAKAEAKGEGSQASVEVNGEKVVCSGDDDGCEVEIISKDELDQEEEMFKEEKIIEETIDLDETEPEKSFSRAVYDFFSDAMGKVMNWFS